MEVEKSILEDDDTTYYQLSDDEKTEGTTVNSDKTSHYARGPYERAWTTEATRALIHLRGPMEEEFCEGRAKRTSLWIQVTKKLHKMGYRYSSAKVQKKWHNILITYNKNISKKEESGSVTWEFFEDMYMYLKGKKAKTFEYPADPFIAPNTSLTKKTKQVKPDHQLELEHQMQQQHQLIQKQRFQMRQQEKQMNQKYNSETDKSRKNSPPGTSQKSNDILKHNQIQIIDDEDEDSTHRYSLEDSSYEQPKSKNMKKINGPDNYIFNSTSNRLPLKISHVQGANEDSNSDDLEFFEESDPLHDNHGNDWWKDYFSKKLERDKEKIELQKQMHNDMMNHNKMCLIQHEKIERIKIEAIKNLTSTLQNLVEIKSHKNV